MKTSQRVIATALFLGLVSASFAGPGAEYFQRRTKKMETTPSAASAPADKKESARSENSACCRDSVSYKPGPSGKTSTKVVKHECSCS